MFAALRRFRLLAAVLLVLSPGGMGTALPVLHPCPVDMPTMARHAGGGMAPAAAHADHAARAMPAMAGQHADHADAAPHAASCHCPGTCCPSAPVVAPSTHALATLRLGHVARPQAPPAAAPLAASRLADLLPPSTAPPTLV